jgi:hypothetical protein
MTRAERFLGTPNAAKGRESAASGVSVKAEGMGLKTSPNSSNV